MAITKQKDLFLDYWSFPKDPMWNYVHPHIQKLKNVIVHILTKLK